MAIAHRGLHVTDVGSGTPALFFHGSFGWGLDTFPEQRTLADAYRVLLVDRRGFGGSPPGEIGGWPTDAEDAAALLDELGPAHVVGQSYGAVVALLAAGLRSERVLSLVVIEPPAFGLAPADAGAESLSGALADVYARAQGLTTAEFVRGWYGAYGGSSAEADAWMATFGDEEWTAADASRHERFAGEAPIALDAVARIAGPKVVVWGGAPGREAVRAAYRAVCEAVADGAGADLVVFDRSLHNPQLEEADRFNALLRDVWVRAA